MKDMVEEGHADVDNSVGRFQGEDTHKSRIGGGNEEIMKSPRGVPRGTRTGPNLDYKKRGANGGVVPDSRVGFHVVRTNRKPQQCYLNTNKTLNISLLPRLEYCFLLFYFFPSLSIS